MSELDVQLGDRRRTIPAPATVADAIKACDRDALKSVLAARVNGEETDLGRALSSSNDVIHIEPIGPDSPDGLEVLRHSTAHLLAAAVLELFPGAKLGVGPALMDDPRYGFFYDVIAPRNLNDDDLPVIEKKMRELAKRSLPYRREEIEKAKLIDIFRERDEPLKCELIDEKAQGMASVYYIDGSPFIDFCLGPHVPHTGKLKAFKLLALSGAYWKGDASNPQMQRIYGTAFATQEQLDNWIKQREEAERRDHRRLGRELDLFSISDEYGPGLILWHPKGGIIRNEMERLLREELERRGYSFVFTPHIAKRDLWFTSGHEDNYADSMYSPTTIEDEEYRIKPMNCPFHIGIYRSSPRSYRDLPQRYSEMGTVYRAELSGTLHGLMRVRGFSVDDAHLFVREDQIHREVVDCLEFAKKVFETYGFEDVRFELSVRGAAENKQYLGSEEEWLIAEAKLASALDEQNIAYERIEGEAAFYGPKIDIKIADAIGRIWQLGTIQLDFNLPARFDLEYTAEDNQKRRPFMIHRALFGSIERFFGILIEHYAGAFPLWLAPVQVVVLPITDRVNDYALSVAAELKADGFRVEANTKSDKIGAKIRDAELMKVPYMLVLGDKELHEGIVAVRERKMGDIGTMSLAEFKERISRQRLARSL